jgi:outer membrane immunogenic protein
MTKSWNGFGRLGAIAAAALSLTLASSAGAADLPMKSAPPPPPPPAAFTWTGFYFGANIGAAWSNAGNVTVSDPVLGSQSIGVGSHTGFEGGGQIGYNFQAGSFVYGLETDIQGIDTGSTIHWGPYGKLGLSTGSSGGYFGTVRGRLGYAIDRTLLYFTGGLAYGGLVANPLQGGATSNVGYALGGGVEYGLTQNWTVKVEGLYVNLSSGSSRTVYVTNGGLLYPVNANNGNGGGVVRVGVNYLF